MNSFAFEAKYVAVENPDGGGYLVGFADDEFDTEIYLMLQRAFEFDEQDVELGMNTYHVEWCGQQNSGYGGISRFVLGRRGVEVTFAPDTVQTLSSMERISISFQLTPFEHAELQKALGHIFQDNGCLVVTDD